MLQQTQVDRVLPKYHEWLEKYPSFEALADAPESGRDGHVVSARLQHPAEAPAGDCARGGRILRRQACRRTKRRCCRSKGIGAYTAGAIRSFAFRERAAILDTNVARVLFRVFIGKGVPKAHATKKDLWSISAALVPRSRAFDFNQALMDFGAMLCTARKPKCLICPMASLCAAYPHNPENEKRA